MEWATVSCKLIMNKKAIVRRYLRLAPVESSKEGLLHSTHNVFAMRVESCCQTKGSGSTMGQLRMRDSSSAILPNHRARTGVRTPIDTTRGGGGR